MMSGALPAGWETSIPSFPGRRQRHGDARRLGKNTRCDRDEAADLDRRLGGSKSVDVHGVAEDGRF